MEAKMKHCDNCKYRLSGETGEQLDGEVLWQNRCEITGEWWKDTDSKKDEDRKKIAEHCKHYEEEQKTKIAKKIKEMETKELAEFIGEICSCKRCPAKEFCGINTERATTECGHSIMAWLNKEA